MKQAIIVLYNNLSDFLLENNFERDHVDKIVFMEMIKNKKLIVQIYVDYTIFACTNVVF